MSYKRYPISCLLCKSEISVNNLHIHYNSKQCQSGGKVKSAERKLRSNCIFCNKEYNLFRALTSHEVACKLNPIKKSTTVKNKRSSGHTPWNKGLTKHDDPRLMAAAESISKTMKESFNSGYKSPIHTAEYWTAEKRKEKSDWRIQLHKDNPETHPNRRLAGNRNKMTYPEKVAFDYLTANNFMFEHQKQILNFYIDFCIGNKIIEIDGERWHPIGNKKDADRDKKLQELGYNVYRIRSKENIESRIKEILR